MKTLERSISALQRSLSKRSKTLSLSLRNQENLLNILTDFKEEIVIAIVNRAVKNILTQAKHHKAETGKWPTTIHLVNKSDKEIAVVNFKKLLKHRGFKEQLERI